MVFSRCYLVNVFDTDPHGWVKSRNEMLRAFIVDLELAGLRDFYERALVLCEAFQVDEDLVRVAKHTAAEMKLENARMVEEKLNKLPKGVRDLLEDDMI